MKKNREISSEFAKSMEVYRIKKGISLNQLGRNIGISPAYLSRIKNRKRNAPSVPIAMAIAKELDMPFEHLMSVLGMNEEVRDIFELLTDNEFSINGKLADSTIKEAIVGVLKSVLPVILKGDIR